MTNAKPVKYVYSTPMSTTTRSRFAVPDRAMSLPHSTSPMSQLNAAGSSGPAGQQRAQHRLVLQHRRLRPTDFTDTSGGPVAAMKGGHRRAEATRPAPDTTGTTARTRSFVVKNSVASTSSSFMYMAATRYLQQAPRHRATTRVG